MIPQTGQTNFKDLQDRYTKRSNVYLKNTAESIKQFKPNKRVKEARVQPTTTSVNQNPSQSESSEKLGQLADKVGTPLMKFTTIPYLKIFPITITLDLKKITINTTNFIESHSIQTLVYENLRDVEVDTGILSATLRLSLSGQTQHPIILPNFKNAEAVRAKQIIIGLMNCQKAQIKPDDLDPEKDLEKIVTIGRAASP